MIKINKREARKVFAKGERVYLLPCKVRLNNMWIQPFLLSKEFYTGEVPDDFDSIVANFEFYNCNEELGRYAAFYVMED